MARGIEVHNGKVVLGDIVSLLKSIDLGQGKTITNRIEGGRFEIDDPDNWSNPSLIGADMFGLWVLVQVGQKPSGSSTMLRLEANTKSDVTLDSAYDVIAGGDLSYLFKLHPGPGKSAWSGSGAVANTMGYIKIRVGNDDRYIQLYGTPP